MFSILLYILSTVTVFREEQQLTSLTNFNMTQFYTHLWPQSGEFYTKIGRFPIFYKNIRIFIFFARKLPKSNFFSRLNSDI